jgi:hypothetical protein
MVSKASLAPDNNRYRLDALNGVIRKIDRFGFRLEEITDLPAHYADVFRSIGPLGHVPKSRLNFVRVPTLYTVRVNLFGGKGDTVEKGEIRGGMRSHLVNDE